MKITSNMKIKRKRYSNPNNRNKNNRIRNKNPKKQMANKANDKYSNFSV